MKSLTLFSTFLIITTFINNTYAQSGWTQGEGKYYVKASLQSITSDTFFSQTGQQRQSDDFTITSLGVYGEYGKTDKLTITGFVPVFSSFSDIDVNLPENDVFDDINSTALGDAELGLKYRLFKKDWIATAITGKLRIPTGGGEFNQGLTLSAGIPLFNFGKFATYSNLYGGANNRPSDFSDELRYGFEFGIGYNNKLWLFAKQDNIKSFDNVDIDLSSSEIGVNELFGNRYEVESISIELAYYITPKFGISLNYLNTYGGQLVLKGSTYNGGLFWNLR